jgi:hypothetical protein
MLFPIFGSEEEPGYLISTPVKFGVKVNSRNQVTAKQGVSVNAVRTLTLKQSVGVKQQNLIYSIQAVAIGSRSSAISKQSVFIRSGEGFTILADIYPQAFEDSGTGGNVTGGGTYPIQYIRPYLAIDGLEIPIVDFNYERPEGRLGAILSARLAVFEISGLVPFMRVDFGYIIFNPNTETEHFVPRMTNGKLMGWQLNIGFQEQGQRRGPADTVSISAIDVVADRFNIRPLRPVTMYDPAKTNTTEVTHFDSDSTLRLLNGAMITPIFIRQLGLGTGQALYEAYVYGLGFDRVVSNIPNYEIARADFTIEEGWHSGALPFFAMYGPLFFDSFNILFILNITWPLPSGFTPRTIHNSDYQRLGIISPVKDYTNSLILSYKASGADLMAEEGIFFTYRFDQDTQEDGLYGTPGYQRTETTRKIREVRNTSDPLNIISELEEQSIVEVYAQMQAGLDGEGAPVLVGSVGGVSILVHKETQDNIYDGNGLKTSHHKTVQAAILNWQDKSVNVQDVLDEKCTIEWVTTDDPNVMVQSRSKMIIEGLVAQAVNERELTPSGGGASTTVHTLYPVVAAQYNGLAVEDVPEGVYNPWVKIRTITETLRHTKGNQVDVEVKDFDNLTGTMRASVTQPRTGTPLTSLYQAKVRHILIEDEESIALIGPRIPAAVNAGELPRVRAIQLSKDVLKYIQTPRFDAQVVISGIDLSIDKGSVIIPRKRDEDASHFIVTGVIEHGEPKGSGYQIIMTLKGQEVSAS